MLRSIALSAVVLLMAGCAGIHDLRNEVSTYGQWPAERKPSTFAFERLPSQQAHPERQQMLEDAARGAIEAAGFRATSDPGDAEYLMQIGARVSSGEPWIYNEPMFYTPWSPWYWRGGFHHGFGPGPWRHGWGPGWGWGWGYPYAATQTYAREVAVVIRDRRTGQVLYEARANNTGTSAAIEALLPAMFEAAMKDFPGTGPNPREVTVRISKR